MSRYVVYPAKERKGFYTDIFVMDTTKPTMIGDEHWKENGQKMYARVCECDTHADALMIAKALNKSEEAKVNTKSKSANERKMKNQPAIDEGNLISSHMVLEIHANEYSKCIKIFDGHSSEAIHGTVDEDMQLENSFTIKTDNLLQVMGIDPKSVSIQRNNHDIQVNEETRKLLQGLMVSMDVSTCDEDSGNRYFGVIDEVMDSSEDKNGVILLVQNPEPNF